MVHRHVSVQLQEEGESMNDIEIISVRHKEMTDEEEYNIIKRLHKKRPDIYQDPEVWKKRQMKRLKQQGRKWST